MVNIHNSANTLNTTELSIKMVNMEKFMLCIVIIIKKHSKWETFKKCKVHPLIKLYENYRHMKNKN